MKEWQVEMKEVRMEAEKDARSQSRDDESSKEGTSARKLMKRVATTMKSMVEKVVPMTIKLAPQHLG